jgi:ArsR family transcriptional regulator
MNGLSPADADEYARWFRCLADGTRVRILSIIAAADGPLSVGEVVAAADRSQSTVSRHLHLLADDEFIHLHADGTRTLVEVNAACMTALPDAAAAIMGRR